MISILGAGSWGLALSLILLEKGNEVTVWCHDEKEKEEILLYRENKRCLPNIKLPLELKFTTSMEQAIKGAEIVIFAVPSMAIRAVAKQVKNFISKEAIIINVSKGIEKETNYLLSEVINEELPNRLAVLSGPSHAEEVARQIPTTVVATSLSIQVAKEIQELFMTNYFRVYTSTDLIGVEIGGALKNVIALAIGVIDGVGYGDNTKAAVMTRGMAEICRLGIAMGGKAETFAGLTGMGDLIVTCTSKHSRNRRCGELIGQGYSIKDAIKKVNMVVEGITTAYGAYALMKKYNVEMPILEAIYDGLENDNFSSDVIEKLMNREKKMENV
ncbi:glycerol-3-phosphate dehydrogenase [Candidatus Epulonipiscium fishelsonii]|uniref:Glycerol-3-phosphate dehydrogenase n=1 Tax=Candidatus Epulonipiscium fishelsonii TaxID=77094 RepID=A0ACC8XF31_9FIRM|nr:glycerol-3-phosphate dehydrogenase [Epulopiscium sp. SCG-B05WGA-EpuloA1]ONI41889.1 glycerol-3-phosphate dehydrogenase [Epulopiscium sp. SCG-B11WGA-EpuloA1]ONI48041.1 glycerol-3-phosphate dehydrogenase [Epulopiscium sp. SCG-C06WGA-EpuloA1]